jgi:hypothetical protein
VQRDCIYLAGNGSCPSSHRNLYDFNDITVDKQGRVLVGYADGCSGTCDTDPKKNSLSHVAQIARLSCGRTLFAAYDPGPKACSAVASASSGGSTPTAAAPTSAATRLPLTTREARGVALLPLWLGLTLLALGAAIARRRSVRKEAPRT